jgi:beta-lactamase class A
VNIVLRPDADLDAQLARATCESGLAAHASAFLCDPDGLRYGQYRSRDFVYPASVIKVTIMAEAFRRFAEGSLAPDAVVTVSEANETATAGPAPFRAGVRTTPAELVEYMIVYSDNVATNQLIDLLGRDAVTSFMRSLGLRTFLLGRKLSGSEPLVDDPQMTGRNRFVAYEAGLFFTLLARDELPGSKAQQALLERCADGGKLVPGLAPGDRFAHKTGETSDLSHDAGILVTAGGRRWIVVLYLHLDERPGQPEASWANPLMNRWMRLLRENL